MNLVRPIITSLLIVYVRIRIINTIFSQKKIKISITLKILGLGILMVGTLLAYTYLFTYFPALNTFNLANFQHFNPQSLIFFIIYCLLFITIITIFFKNRYRRIAQIIVVGGLFFVALAYGGYLAGVSTLLLYTLISAYAEEYMKYSGGNNMFLNAQETNESGLIFFCILVGLWFSAIENIAYIVNTLLNHETVNIINVLVGRGLVSTLIHIVSTSLIAFIMIKTKKTNSIILPVILGIIGGFGLHSLYNVGLQYNLTYVTIPMIIISFFLMTYLTFQSDIIYRQQQKS